jgi:phosphate transport system substrate-binding protein
MKKYLVLFLTVLLSACSSNETKDQNKTEEPSNKKSSLQIKGSDTVLPLSQKAAEEYMKKDNGASVTVVGGGTGVGISALLDGTTDIAMASRDLKMDEKLKFESKKAELQKVTIGYDALAVIVNPNNKVDKLSKKQLEDIFTGKVTNWKDVGGADEKIIVYSRESSSGTFEFFKEHVMDKKNYGASTLMLPATGSIIQSVGQTKGAIGYVGLAYLNQTIKPLAVSFEGDKFEKPSVEAAMNGSYPVSRPLFYFYKKADEQKVKSFVDYLVSAEGQKIVAEIGYVPLSK